MKLKGIGKLEQHVEKIVVGAVGVGLLGVVGWQFLGQSKVQVGKDSVSIADAYAPVVNAANAMKRDAENASPTLPTADAQEIHSFAESAGRPVARGGPLPPLTHAIELGGGGGAVGSADSLFAAWTGPAPTNVIAAQFRGTIQPTERAAIPELVAFLPKEQPYDKAAVSVEATLNGKAIRAALEQDPDGDGPMAALPPDWWMGKMEIVGVEVEREEMGADGSWGGAAVLPPLPGRLDFLKQWRDLVKTEGEASAQLTVAAQRAEEILRPKYYAMMFGDWIEPNVLVAQSASAVNPLLLAQYQQQHREKTEELAKLRAELAALPRDDGRTDPNAGPRTPDGGGGGRGVRGGGGGGGQAAPRPSPTQPVETPAAIRRRLQGRITKLEGELATLKKTIEEGGGRVMEVVDPGAAPVTPTTTDRQERLLDQADFKVFAHDITAEPGKTYRYRVRAVTNNPVFGRDSRLKRGDAGQLELAKSPTASTSWTDWSGPVSVDRDAYWFITSTNTDGIRQNLPTAQASLFQFYYGFYRKIEVALEPGDAIVGTAKLPPLWIYDEKSTAVTTPDAAPAPDGGGGRGRRREGGPEPTPTPDPAAPNDPKQKPANATGPARAEIAFRETSGVIFLDTKSASGERVAVLRNQEGHVVSRSPDEDRKSDVFRRVKNSADAGVLVSTPKIEPKSPVQNPNGRPDEGTPTPPPPGGGGGGGGGG